MSPDRLATKAKAGLAALVATLALCWLGAWLVPVSLAWIRGKPEIVAIGQPWLSGGVLGLVILGIVQRRKQDT